MIAGVLLAASLPCGTAAAATLRQKQAQAASAAARLADIRKQLTVALERSDAAAMALDAARMDVGATTDQLTGLDQEISARQQALDDRAVVLYTTGGLDLVQALFTAGSVTELLNRLDMIALIERSDNELLSGLQTARDQSAFLQRQQSTTENQLISLRQQADARTAAVSLAMAEQKAVMDSLSHDIAGMVRQREEAAAAAAAAAAGGIGDAPKPFAPDTMVSDTAFLNGSAMSAAGVQAFLDGQPGPLKSYVGPDHTGVRKTAAEIITDAAAAWNVNPRVLLVTLQKEQSLISRTSPSAQALDWAMGCGKTDSVTLTQYRGFGNQVWGGARALQRNRGGWYPGVSLSIDGAAVYPSNASTFSLYRYTPHLHGNTVFWRLYWHYFGDPVV